MAYPWPASAVSREEMALLYHAREATTPRVPITELIRRAITKAYGQQASAGTQEARVIPEPVQKAA